jgi:hypothetical protein
VGLAAAAPGSDKWPEKPTFCGFPTADWERKKNVLNGRLGGGKELAANILFARLRALARSAVHIIVRRLKPLPLSLVDCPARAYGYLVPTSDWRFDIMTRGGSPVR